jgi:hypothetical protein
LNTNQSSWKVGADIWAHFVQQHPELGYRPGKWQFHNFLRFHRDALVATDAIRLAKNRFWIGHVERFPVAAFACATGMVDRTGQQGLHAQGAGNE